MVQLGLHYIDMTSISLRKNREIRRSRPRFRVNLVTICATWVSRGSRGSYSVANHSTLQKHAHRSNARAAAGEVHGEVAKIAASMRIQTTRPLCNLREAYPRVQPCAALESPRRPFSKARIRCCVPGPSIAVNPPAAFLKVMLDEPLAALVAFLHGPLAVDNARRSDLSSEFVPGGLDSGNLVYSFSERASTWIDGGGLLLHLVRKWCRGHLVDATGTFWRNV